MKKIFFLLLVGPLSAQQPESKMQYAPDRDYDLQHVALRLKVDYAKLAFDGQVENSLIPLRGALDSITLQCGANLRVKRCAVEGRKAVCDHQGDALHVRVSPPLEAGRRARVVVEYESAGEAMGLHWIKPDVSHPQRVGFFTLGATSGHPSWLPTWNYPNDFATSETWVTVPPDWQVIGNGALKSDILDPNAKTRTFHWQMDQPHATYLIWLAAGPFDIKTDTWQGVPLMYVVPKGRGERIAATFGQTSELLSFYSNLFQVKYPWPKYAQTALYDFSTNMEWVSASAFGEGLLRNGGSSTLIAHEMVHQWFGDLVTCRDWGDLWLNEGFASYFGQMLYAEHWRGKDEFDHQLAAAMRAYFAEGGRNDRPLSTRYYSTPSKLFDTHTYQKGALVLHMLRRRMGDKAFFAGIHHYLTKYRHSPVDAHDFAASMTEATGLNLEPFFDEWVYRPGHPILDYTWRWDENAKRVLLTVKQQQATTVSGPLYTLDAKIALISGDRIAREAVAISGKEQEFSFAAAAKPDAVLLDPDYDLLREVPVLHWTAEELPHILAHAPSAEDRETAMNMMLDGTPSDQTVRLVTTAVSQDRGQFPTFRSTRKLAELRREDLGPFWRDQLQYQKRRTQAISALALLRDERDLPALRAFVNAGEDESTIDAVVSGLAQWDAPGNRDVFSKAAAIGAPGSGSILHLDALAALAKADVEEGKNPDPDSRTKPIIDQFLADAASGNKESQSMTAKMLEYVMPRGRTVADWLKNRTSFTYVMRQDVERQGIERRGAAVNYLAYFKMTTALSRIYIEFFMTSDGKVADWDVTIL